ncbi:glycosyltransferase [Shewanella algae]|uniref:glycosyltransferase n=1 Tax=Shewanella algae TaxID=38313 RepID=UPI003006A3F1
MKFSVLMSVYKNDIPLLLERAIKSISFEQTIRPNQIVLVVDGPIGADIESKIEYFDSKLVNLVVVRLEKNVGLANALNHGLKYCQYEIVFRMDSDDYSLPNRFEKQLKVFEHDSSVSVVGTQITEVDPDSNQPTGNRRLPLSFDEIKEFSIARNPLNHMTVAFKKSHVVEVGGYKHLLYLEDYYLWLRLISKNKVIVNLPDILVYATTGRGMLARRGGFNYVKSEFQLFNIKNNLGVANFFVNVFFLIVRTTPRLLPVYIRGMIYKILRGK